MKHTNSHYLAGKVTDVMARKTKSGKSVLVLTVAATVNGSTSYHRVVLWEGLARKYISIRVSDEVHVIGPIRTRTYVANNGSKRTVTETIARTVVLHETVQKEPPSILNNEEEPPTLEEMAEDTEYFGEYEW